MGNPPKGKRKAGDKLCGAVKNGGGVCRHESGWGTDHPGTGRCKFHGGSSESGQMAAAKELGTLAAIEQAAGMPVEVNPLEALLVALYSAVALSNSARALLNYWLEHDEPGKAASAKIVYHEALDRQHTYASSCVRLGIAERQVRMVEQAGEQILALFRIVLADLEVPMDRAQPVLARRFGELATGTIIPPTTKE